MAETNAIDRFITTTLAADSVITTALGSAKIYADLAPQLPAPIQPPYVVFSMMSSVDLRIVGPYRVWADCIYDIVCYAEQNSYTGVLKTVADRIDADLHAVSGSNVDGTIFACWRISAIRLTDPPVDGRVIKRLGGRYRIYAHAA